MNFVLLQCLNNDLCCYLTWHVVSPVCLVVRVFSTVFLGDVFSYLCECLQGDLALILV